MGRLFVLFFLLPWWAYVPASIGALWVGERFYEQVLAIEAEKVAALEAPVPDPVDLADFDMFRDIHPADEVHVVGMIDHDLDYELVERTNGVRTSTRYLYMIFGSDGAESRVVRAALMLDKREDAAFLDTKADEWSLEASDTGRVYAFNGFAETSMTLDELVDGSIEEQGLTKAEDFIFIEPFFEGRAAALAPHAIPEQSRYIGWLIAGALALIGVVKRVMSVRARPARGEEAEMEPAEIDGISPPPAPAFAVPQGVPEDTPLGRIARRSAQSAVPARVEDPGYASFDDPDPELSDPLLDEHGEPTGARPALADNDGAHLAGAARSPFPRMGEIEDAPAPAQVPQSSALAYYVKLLLAMLVVGALAYDPTLFDAALPVAAIALFWFAVYVVVRNLRRGRAQPAGPGDPAPQHSRRPDGAAQPVAAGVGGPGIDLTAPVRSARRARGVI